VVTRWRLPATRAVFEESLLLAVHGVQEANAIAAAMAGFVRFRVVGSAIVDPAKLVSLRLEDAMPHHAVGLTVRALLNAVGLTIRTAQEVKCRRGHGVAHCVRVCV